MAEMINMPKLGFDMAEGSLVRWVKKEGESVRKGDILAEIETDKATVEVESSAEGILRKLLVNEGAIVPVSTPIAIIGTADEDITTLTLTGVVQKALNKQLVTSETQKPETAQSSQVIDGKLRASPIAKRLARENEIDLMKVHGSGPGGRIVRRDIEAAVIHLQTSEKIHSDHENKMIPMKKLRQAIGRRMVEAKTSIPHFYITHVFKMDNLLEIRRQINNMLAENDKVSVNDFIIKGAALALREFPNLNASLQDESITQHGQVNIGVAVAVEGGLLTVVCKTAAEKSLHQISRDVKDLARRAREGKVRPDDIEGSTFTISNLGMYAVDEFMAIINPPEAAILAVGSAKEVPVVESSNIRSAWMMKATLSVDHRISDGVEAAKFMQALAVFIEEPVRLLI